MFKFLQPFMKKEDMEALQKTIAAIFRMIQETHEKTLENNRMLRQILTPAQLKKAEVV